MNNTIFGTNPMASDATAGHYLKKNKCTDCNFMNWGLLFGSFAPND